MANKLYAYPIAKTLDEKEKRLNVKNKIIFDVRVEKIAFPWVFILISFLFSFTSNYILLRR